MEIPKQPFSILALAPLAELPERPAAFTMMDVDGDSLDAAVAALAPTLAIPAAPADCPEGFLYFKPAAMKDFKPHRLVARIPYLSALMTARQIVDDGRASGADAATIASRIETAAPGLPLDLSAATAPAAAPSRQQSAVDDLLSMVAGGDQAVAASGAGGPRDWLRQIDALLGRLLACVYSDPGYRRLEAAWQGVAALVRQAGITPGGAVSLSIASISSESLETVLKQVTAAVAPAPPNLMLVDLECDATDPGIARLDAVLTCADALMTPAAVWVGPGFFHLPDWQALGKLPYISHHLENAAYAKWRKRRQAPGSEWVAVTANRFTARAPYGAANPARPVAVEESSPLWLSPVWALGILTARSVSRHGWPSRFTDYRSLTLTDLAVVAVAGERTAATEALIADERIAEFIEAGITPIAGSAGRDTAAIVHEATLAGGSLKFQLFFNRLMGFLFSLKARMAAETDPHRIAASVSDALAAFFQTTGQDPPEDIRVEWQPSESGSPVLSIGLTPPVAALPGPSPISFTLVWD